jgi:DNA-binding NarL/FixJ family response regulator
LVQGSEQNDAQLFGALQQDPRVELERLTLSAPFSGLAAAPFDVCIVTLSHENLETLSFSLRMRKHFGHPEVVFVTDDLAGPIASGLSELGLELIIPVHLANEWLSEELPTLTIMARTRRAHEAAKARLGLARGKPYPDLRATSGLFAAEQTYRETYVRALLSLTDSRREAAAKARVSYRALSHILTKLGITTRTSREDSNLPAGPGEKDEADES